MRARVPRPSHKDYVVRPKWGTEEGVMPKVRGVSNVFWIHLGSIISLDCDQSRTAKDTSTSLMTL